MTKHLNEITTSNNVFTLTLAKGKGKTVLERMESL